MAIRLGRLVSLKSPESRCWWDLSNSIHEDGGNIKYKDKGSVGCV